MEMDLLILLGGGGLIMHGGEDVLQRRRKGRERRKKKYHRFTQKEPGEKERARKREGERRWRGGWEHLTKKGKRRHSVSLSFLQSVLASNELLIVQPSRGVTAGWKSPGNEVYLPKAARSRAKDEQRDGAWGGGGHEGLRKTNKEKVRRGAGRVAVTGLLMSTECRWGTAAPAGRRHCAPPTPPPPPTPSSPA